MQVVAAVNNGEPEIISVADFEAVRSSLFDAPARRKSAFMIA
jgi:hypothetical protein